MLDERARNRMHNRLREVMGDDVADTMIDSLPPTGWHELATKQDLADSERRLDLKLEAFEQRLTAAFERALRTQTKTYIAWTTALTAMLVAVFTAVGG